MAGFPGNLAKIKGEILPGHLIELLKLLVGHFEDENDDESASATSQGVGLFLHPASKKSTWCLRSHGTWFRSHGYRAKNVPNEGMAPRLLYDA